MLICKLENLNLKNTLSNDFYLNNFNANNVISSKLLNDNKNHFPNSEQLYYKKENNDYSIYFIRNNIEYYLYLNIENKKQLENTYNFDIDIVFRKKRYGRYKLFKMDFYTSKMNIKNLYLVLHKHHII